MTTLRELVEAVPRRVEEYRKLGVNPLALATGCAVKVDLERVVYPAIRRLKDELKGAGLEIAPREDADVFPVEDWRVGLSRVPVVLEGDISLPERLPGEGGSARAIVLVQVHQRNAGSPEAFYSKIAPVYKSLAGRYEKLYIGKGHSIVTPFQGDEFMLIDFITGWGGKGGYAAANNDTIHIIDPTSPPDDYRQVAGAINNAMNDVLVMGATLNIEVAPVVNSPSEELTEKILAAAKRHLEEIGAKLVDVETPPLGRLLMGATVIGYSDRKPPMFYDLVEPGDVIIATRPFGELAAITVFLAASMDPGILEELEKLGLDDIVVEAKDEVFNLIATPNTGAGETIRRFLPKAWEEPRREESILATIDVTGPGVYVVWELAVNAGVEIELWEVPLLYPELSRYVASRFLMANATSGTNGAFIILAPSEVAEEVLDELRKRGYVNARIIGRVTSKKGPRVKAPRELEEYVVDKAVLQRFTLE